MKKFLSVLYQPWVTMYEMVVRDLPTIKKVLGLVLTPIFFSYLVFYVIMFIFTFVSWDIPSHIPIPFVGDLMVDRVLIFIGVCLLVDDIMSEG